MSLILEALRKSEAERQVGQPPGLLTPVGLPPPPSARRWWPWALLLGVVVAAAAGWAAHGWLNLRPPANPIAALPATEAGAPTDAASVTTPPPAPARSAALPTTGAAERAAPAPPAAVTSASMKPTAAAMDAGRSPAPEPAGLAAPSVPEPTAPQAVPAAAVAAKPTSTRPAYATLDLMPASERAALPALKLSVHVFHREPARRFAIIDGRRVGEGAALNSQLQVVAIQDDGVLLQVNGRSWLLPRP